MVKKMLNNELKKNPFITPKSYFDRLPSIIQDKSIEAKKSPVFGLIPKFAFAGGGFMVLALALFLAILHNSNPPFEKPEETRVAVSGIVKPSNEDIRLKSSKNAMIDYLAVRNINKNDIILAKSKYKN